jgi:hypothetical protein
MTREEYIRMIIKAINDGIPLIVPDGRDYMVKKV